MTNKHGNLSRQVLVRLWDRPGEAQLNRIAS